MLTMDGHGGTTVVQPLGPVLYNLAVETALNENVHHAPTEGIPSSACSAPSGL